MENGELCVATGKGLGLVGLQQKLFVGSLAWSFKNFLIQCLDHLVVEFGWIMFSVMEMKSPYLTVHTMDGAMLQIVPIMMMLD